MALTPYPYQLAGAEFLAARRRAYLADEMGLGKTAQAILAAREVAPTGTLTVVCPAAARENWRRELVMWGYSGTAQVFSYSGFVREAQGLKAADVAILDEAHYAKSPSAKRTRAALGYARRCGRAWLLSGTPMPNDPTELWAPMKYLWPELTEEVGTRNKHEWMEKFTKTYPTTWGPKPYAVKNAHVLRSLLKGIMLRRKLSELALDLPPLRVHTSFLPRNKELEKALEDYQDHESEGEEAYVSTLRRLLGTAKAPQIARQLTEELKDGAYPAVVVLHYHKAVREILREEFEGAGLTVTGFDGSTPGQERQKAIDDFQDGRAQVFLAQQSAAGTAITLTAASEIVLVEPAWSPDDNRQAIKRIHRIGQGRPCRARFFCVPKTLDEAIIGTIARKVGMQQEVFENDGQGQ